MVWCDVRGTVHMRFKISKSSRELRCHAPPNLRSAPPLDFARTDNSSTKVGHQRSCCCIDDVLLEDRIHKKVMMEGPFPIHKSSFVFGLPLCSMVVLQNKESCFSGVETISSPTASTRVRLNKEGAAGIGRLQTVTTRVYIGTATATRSQSQIQKTRVNNRTSIACGSNSEYKCV
jgi:hypothetical protein